MQGRMGAVIAASAVALAALVAAAWNSKSGIQFTLDLSLGLFAGLLPALSFVVGLTVRGESSWPSLRLVVNHAGLGAWFSVSAVAVVVAVAAVYSGGSTAGRFAAASVVLSGIAAGLGVLGVFRVLDVAGGRGRRKFLSRALTRSLGPGHGIDGRDPRWLERAEGASDYVDALVLALDTRSLPAVRERVEELVAADVADDLAATRLLVRLELRTAELIGRALLSGQLDAVGTRLLTRIFDDVVESASGILVPTSIRTAESEVEAAALLGHTSRLAAWIHKTAFARVQTPNADRRALATVMAGMWRTRTSIRRAVDPDPPVTYIPPHDPWARGLSVPEAAFQWLWGYTDFDGTAQGEGLYVLCEVLTGVKFFGSYAEGMSVWATIDERLKDLRDGDHQDTRVSSHAFLASVGGLEQVALELCVNSIAAFKDRWWSPPPQLQTDGIISQADPYLAMRLRLFRFVRGDKRLTAEEGLCRLARLLGSGQAGPRLWRRVDARYTEDGLTGAFPVYPSNQRPAASVIAVALLLLPTEERVRADALIEFLDALSDPLVAGAWRFSRRIASHDRPAGLEDAPSRTAAIDTIVNDLQVVNRY